MKHLLLLLLLIFLAGCKSQLPINCGIEYENDSSLSTVSGGLLNEKFPYLPDRFFVDNTDETMNQINTFSLELFSVCYKCFNSPILYNFYLGNENYRFLWLRSFNKPVLITIARNGKITINTKFLISTPETWTKVYLPESETEPSGEIRIFESFETALVDFPQADSIIPPKQKIEIAIDTTYELTEKQWNRFKELVDSCSFWEMIPFERTLGLDGADWILEGQNKNCYQFVFRWNPSGPFRKCCEYLIQLSAAKNEAVY